MESQPLPDMSRGLRTSDYTIYARLPESREFLLVHGYSGAIDLVQPNVMAFLKSRGKSDKDNLIADSTVGVLQQRGYLTHKSPEEEQARVKELADTIQRHQLKTGKGFLFIPAYDCNLHCSYCYETGISGNGTRWTQEVMTKGLVDAAYEAIKQLEPDVERCRRITLYGGEPLLAKNYEIVKHIIVRGETRGHTFGAITNGYDLAHYREFLGKGKIEFLQITSDGPPKVHDSRRKLRDGRGTFGTIRTNVSNALNAGVKISIRINCDRQNISTLKEIDNLFRQWGWLDNPNFRAYASPTHGTETRGTRSEGPSGEQPCTDAALHFRRFEFLTLISEERAKDREISVFDDAIEVKRMIAHTLAKGTLMPFKSAFCGANFGMFIFDPRGDLYTCWELVGQDEARVGRYEPALVFNQALLDQWHGRTVSHIPRCARCKYALFCGGGCEAFAYNKTGCFFTSYCDDFPKIFAKSAAAAYQEHLKDQMKPKDAVHPTA